MDCNEHWSVKKFQNKHDLDKFLDENRFTLVNETSMLCCRFCLAENPNVSIHMVQAYLLCPECVDNNKRTFCTKTNLCLFKDRYELLTKHSNLSADWNTFENSADQSICKNDNSLNWKVKSVFPNQNNLFNEIYIMKINGIWLEFQNGKEKHIFKIEQETPNELRLLRDDFKLFKLDPNCFINITDNNIVCEGNYVLNSTIKTVCIPCSRELNKIVFDCKFHLKESFVRIGEINRIWKGREKMDKKYFKRKDSNTWEEYCNDKLTDTFKFICFNEDNDLIIQRNSITNPDFLRFTSKELFIGKFENFIYTPVYSGSWSLF